MFNENYKSNQYGFGPMINLIFMFFEVPRKVKRIVTLSVDVVFILSAFIGALYLRVGESWTDWINNGLLMVLGLLVLGSIFIWIKLGLYRAVIRYIDIKVLTNIFWGSAMSSLLLVTLLFVTDVSLPRSAPLIYATLILILVSGSRLGVRGLINAKQNREKIPVIIYGAGSAGRQLCLSLQNGSEYNPVSFVDDDRTLQNSSVSGVFVYPTERLRFLVNAMKVEKVLFAIPSITKDRKRQIFNSVEGLKVEMLTIPGTADIVSGKVGVTQLRSVQIEELLGRDEVKSSEALLGRCITEKVVLVSGAGGSIGSELCRKIIMQRPRQLILLERSEYSLYEIEKELTNLDLGVEIYPILGSVRDKNLIDKLFSAYSVQTVYHAAAYKHVPLVEYNVKAGIENNVWGTRIIAQAARDYKADHFVLVSTDKAVRPTNVMGTSKRIAELIVQDLASTSAQTIFSIVRFGNVLGSSGSVIPLFRKQIEKGGPITVTHPEITRYFMTIPEAASLVIQAGAMARGGEVFVLDLGKPVKIAELAKKMVRLMGLTIKSIENPGGDIDIAYTGLRPGEKLYEELLIGGDVTNTEHSRIMRANEISMGSTDLEKLLDEIQVALKVNDLDKVINTLIASPAGFSPSTPLCDIIWKTERSSPAKENNNQKIERNVYALHENE